MQWEARYNDGSALPQYNDDGSENRYADIDRGRLVNFAILRSDGHPVLTLHLDPGQRLIFRRRVEMRPGAPPFVIYLVGWQMTVQGQNVQSIAYLAESGELHLAGAWRENGWFDAVVPVECEL
jgi:hypothetical protein